MMNNIRVIDTGPGKAIQNMAIDWALLQLRGEGVIPDTLRFYTWRDRTVTLGYSQDISRELDPDKCRTHNVETIYRPTGGALVLHQFDLTYSIVAGMPGMSPSKWNVFSSKVGCSLCRGLKGLGLEARCAKGREVRGRRNRGACFSSISMNEITVNGRKIIGNAKRWKNGALLQHGSISVRRSHLTVVDLMAGLNSEERKQNRLKLEEQSTNIECEIGRRVDCNELQHVIFNGFKEEFGEVFQRGELRKFEETRAVACVDRALQGPDFRKISRKTMDIQHRMSAVRAER
jgi:lipoate-protein ligase A